MKASYDELWATTWGDLQRLGPVHRHIREDVVHTVSGLDVESILDVGCGSGQTLLALSAVGSYRLTGVDVSEKALDLAARLVPSARFLCLDTQESSLCEQFDLVMSIQVLEHVVDDIGALKNMAKMARKYVFVSTMQGRMRESEVAIGHVRNYSPLELQCKLNHAGLTVLKMWGWGFPFYTPLYRSAAEWLPGGPPTGHLGYLARLVARLLYELYRLNWPGRGDVLNVLARPAS